jgi:hypothetical protein
MWVALALNLVRKFSVRRTEDLGSITSSNQTQKP